MKVSREDLKVAERIRGLREMHGVRQETVARMLGTARGAIGSLEKGRRTISLKWLQKFSEGLNAPMAYFLEDSKPRRKITLGDPREARLMNAWRRLPSDALRKDFLRLTEHLRDLWGRRRPRR